MSEGVGEGRGAFTVGIPVNGGRSCRGFERVHAIKPMSDKMHTTLRNALCLLQAMLILLCRFAATRSLHTIAYIIIHKEKKVKVTFAHRAKAAAQ